MSLPGTMTDSARARVRIALAAAVSDADQWRATSDVQRRNLLLDAVGSDHRPLVDLLLFAEERGVRERLPVGSLDGDRWELVHAHTALDFASRTFVQIDAARWAVETWAFAGGHISHEQLERRVVEPPRTAPPAVAAATATPSTRQPLARVPQPPLASKVLPAPAAAMVHRILPPGPRWRTQTTPTAARHLASRNTASTIEPAAVVIAVIALIAVPAIFVISTRPNAQQIAALRDAERNAAVSITAPNPTPPSVPQSVASTDAATKRITEALVPGDIRARGIAGRYRFDVQNVEVTGSASCDVVQRRIAARPGQIEQIDHLPGAEGFTFGTSWRLLGHLDADGHFTTDRAQGATRGVQWTVQWSGVFAGDSVLAISDTETSGVLRWRETQECRAITRLVGHRVADGAAR
jgi:hypothetical protein